MTRKALKVGVDGYELPLAIAVQKNAILATSGAGKSTLAVVLAEELFAAGVPWVAVDPKGDWYGIRADADGKPKGLAVPVFGGLHADRPLLPSSGKVLARLIAEHRLTCVLDVSEFDTRQEMFGFLADFATELLKHNREPLHVFAEEADEYLPQRLNEKGNAPRCLGAWTRLARRGRFRGIGTSLISQRSAEISKSVLSQTDNMFALRTTDPRDRKAIAAWVTEKALDAELADTLPSLEDGEAWIWSPQKLKRTEQMTFRRRRTFDAGETPEVGKARPSARLTDIDLDAVEAQIAEEVEKARADDPAELRKVITQLRRELAKRPAEERVVETEKLVEVPAVPEGVPDRLDKLSGRLGTVASDLHVINDELASMRWELEELKLKDWANARGAGTGTPRAATRGRTGPSSERNTTTVGVRSPRPAKPAPSDATGEPVALDKAARSILSILAQFPQGRTHDQLALLTGYSAKASTIGVALSKLRRAAFATEGQPVCATDRGLDYIDGQFEPLPTGEALLEHWRRHKSMDKAARAVLDVLVDVYPEATSQQEVAERTGYSPDASTIGVAMSKLRRLEIADGWRASDEFMEAIGR